MKPAKLPGVEKFKFWDKSLLEEDDDEDDDSLSSINDNDSVDSGQGVGGSGPTSKVAVKKLMMTNSKSVNSPGSGSGDSIDGLGHHQIDGDDENIFIRGYVIRNTCSSLPTSKKSINICDLIDSESTEQHHSLPVYHTCHPSSCHLVHHHHHHHHYHTYRRKVILPISSRLAAKVLTSTNLPLDLFDIRDHYKSTRLREVVVGMTTTTATATSTSSLNGAGVDGGVVVGDGASAGRTTLQPTKRYINNNNNDENIFIHKDTDDNCSSMVKH